MANLDFSSTFTGATAPSAPSDMLDTREAAAFIGVAASSLEVDRCRRRWRIPFYRVGGRRVAYRRADLVAFLDKCRVEC